MMSPSVSKRIFVVLSILFIPSLVAAQNKLAQVNDVRPVVSADSDRVRDGLIGPVRRVRTEVVKLTTSDGKTTESAKRVLLETSEYDLRGAKTQNEYFPVAGAELTGREVYKYDDKGNISEMTLMSAEGALVSKEVYKYEFDAVGNWVKMTTSVAVVSNGQIGFDPTEVTYRTISYYLDATMAKALEPANNSPVANSKPSAPVENNKAISVPTSSGLDKLKFSSSQAVVGELLSGPPAVNKPVVLVSDSAPPPMPHPILHPVSGGVLNGKALALPSPSYPDAARRMRVAGLVQVEVVVDENGKVVSARALTGNASLRDAAVQAALRARFSPTKLSGQPVKVTGMINYNFTLPQ